MKRCAAVSLLALLIACGISARLSFSAQEGELEITYLANEGFLLTDGQHKVLLDALIRESYPGYERVPADALEKLESAQAPFDRVNLVLATHFHPDHFSAPSVVRHLANDPGAVFIGPQQAVDAFDKQSAAFANLRERVTPVTPDWKQSRQLTAAGIELRVLRLKHGDAQNVAYLFTLGGKKILHVGDADGTVDNFEPFQLADEEIDIAFIPYWYLLDPEGQKVVREVIWPSQIIVMHVPLDNPDEPRLKEQLDLLGGRLGLLEKVRARFAEAIIFDRPLDTRRF